MAGVFAFIAARGDAARRRDTVVDGLAALSHRGVAPQGAEALVTPDSAAILGGEPLRYPSAGSQADRYVIAFDGDILNASALRDELWREHDADFTTTSDAEVVVAAYHHRGPSAMTALRGSYAFVIWDSRTRRAFGARDPWGIRPLYHLVTADGLYLASEKKALLPLLGDGIHDVDPACLAHFLTMQYVPEPATLHPPIGRIGAGESFAYTPGGPLANRRLINHTFHPVQPDDPAVLYGQILEALRDSVHVAARGQGAQPDQGAQPNQGAQPDHAAQPVGAFLSGGLDSAAVVALAREVNPAIATFTVGYDVDGYSECEQAEAVAAELAVPWTPVLITAADVRRVLPRVLWLLDDPIADPAVAAEYLLAERAGRDVRVVLTGDGADELFGGYGLYREPVSLARVSGLPDPLRRGLRAVSRIIPEGVKGRSFLERGTTPVEERYSGSARVFTDADRAALLRHDDVAVRAGQITAPVYAEGGRLDDVTRMQLVDLYTRLRGDVLVKADRLTAAHGLRLRTPFLDAGVFAVAATIPTELRVPARTHETKAALRRALTGVVPADVVHRRRAPIRTPIAAWLRGDLGEWTDTTLADSGAGELIDLQHARMLLAAHRAGEADHARQLWTVLVFCVWYAVFVTGTLSP